MKIKLFSYSKTFKSMKGPDLLLKICSSQVKKCLLCFISDLLVADKKHCFQKNWFLLKQYKYTCTWIYFHFSGIQEAKIVIATYGLLSKATSRVVLQALTNQKFQVVIVDESHYIRNIKTASCKAIGPLIRAANRRILLSGTPSLSKPVEVGYWWIRVGVL